MEETVTLIIKAANQSTPDQRLECDSGWTIAILKAHLANTHPAHPKTAEQRLIYSGQLLADQNLLCNVLRRPSEENAYTIHLVCSPPQASHQPRPSPPQAAPAPARPQNQSPRTTNRDSASSTDMATTTPVSAASSSASSTPPSVAESTDGVRRRNPPTSTTTPTPQDLPGPSPAPAPSPAPVGGVLQPSADPMHQVAAMQQIYAQYMAYVQ
ncbi:Homocysteine-responsive endoplasmic reticulum-resident ubiquitin-like domain member 2 protein [Chionoecetes opilio]|uniref:Homocysteine-responsive endoplasmic reticulum-resident ubiquitin-like domain member 2 protein n=1 Tax=Chionoecetes opilio TaxID=41210 RepID=A0A8J4Y3Z4_CHIOP|nr:Homocysteine-responsive endoplasmic reticulum-resident ubiquitin-like domain member 2 protein [Chionoecetes opilio]